MQSLSRARELQQQVLCIRDWVAERTQKPFHALKQLPRAAQLARRWQRVCVRAPPPPREPCSCSNWTGAHITSCNGTPAILSVLPESSATGVLTVNGNSSSTVTATSLTQDLLVKIAKKLKKNNVAVDIVSFGHEADNEDKLTAFHGAVNSNDNSHLVTVPPGPVLSDVLIGSPIFQVRAAGSRQQQTTLWLLGP